MDVRILTHFIGVDIDRVRGLCIMLLALAGRTVIAADCNGNGKDDAIEIATGASADCNTNGQPDECDLVTLQFPRLYEGGGTSLEQFGNAVDIFGDTAIIGAHLDRNPSGFNAGAAYVYVRNGTSWALQNKLTPSDLDANDNFGVAVAIYEDTVVVGSDGDDDDGDYSGAAYVFVRIGNSWFQQDKLTAADATVDDFFGGSVAIWEDTIVVGAANAGTGNGAGAAYIFSRQSAEWSQVAKLVGEDTAEGEDFGRSVSLSGDVAMVGSLEAGNIGTSAGTVYVFEQVGGVWSSQGRLTASDGAAGDLFGVSIDLSTGIAVVGSEQDDDAGLDSGSAYIFVRIGDTWIEHSKLVAFDGAAGDGFGTAVGIFDNTVIIGAPRDDVGPWPSGGAAYVFREVAGSWQPVTKVLGDASQAGSAFGASVAVSGQYMAIGQPGAADNQGFGYIFQVPSTDENGNGVPDECENDCNLNGVSDDLDITSGTSEDCNSSALPDECEPDTDNDGFIDNCDNCPGVANASQNDFDGDGEGDICDTDIDGDGVLNETDVCDYTPLGAPIQPDGRLRADEDGDCDVDLRDFAIMQVEFTGPGARP